MIIAQCLILQLWYKMVVKQYSSGAEEFVAKLEFHRLGPRLVRTLLWEAIVQIVPLYETEDDNDRQPNE